MVTVERVWAALAAVPDPELPVVSLVELGVIGDVEVDGDRVRVELLPTFLGCPALETMRSDIEAGVRALGAQADVDVRLDDRWTSDRISPAGRAKLEAAGIGAPPPAHEGALLRLDPAAFRCPHCGSRKTTLENLFGATPCRSQRYCNACRQPFEQLKAI
jgi:ring-1,2-phenylacetyl-CoA epoxidase subunit PaaD